MKLKGKTYFSVGDLKNPVYISECTPNSSLDLNESKVFASFAKGDSVNYFKYLAVGGGDPSIFLNSGSYPTTQFIINNYLDLQPSAKLFNEFYRVELSHSFFVDESITEDYKFVRYNTGVIELVWTIPNKEAIGYWREVGIFSGDASKEFNTGTLVHYQVIKEMHRTSVDFSGRALNWHWRIDFRVES